MVRWPEAVEGPLCFVEAVISLLHTAVRNNNNICRYLKKSIKLKALKLFKKYDHDGSGTPHESYSPQTFDASVCVQTDRGCIVDPD